MTKYMVLYNSTASASEVMAAASPEEMKASMGEWMQWRDEASDTVKVDFGMPLQAVSNVSAESARTGRQRVLTRLLDILYWKVNRKKQLWSFLKSILI